MTFQPSDRGSPELSVVLCTYNRSTLLAGSLDALVTQTGAPPYEVVVVDNNSSDDTRAVIERFEPGGIVRRAFEPAQGLSLARNRGVAAARAPVLAFTDDDVRVAPTWVRSIVTAFAESPDVEIVGGKVEPDWEADPPSWLSHAGLAPLALVDYGDRAFRITPEQPRCLVGANLAVRRRAFDRARGFSTALQRVGDGIGSTEDHDFQMRLLEAGASALYDPRIVARAVVPRGRLSKRYHRAWHQGHGRFYALMRDPSFERSSRGTFLGVPGHVYRSALAEGAAWLASLLSGRSSAAFAHELRLRFLTAFAVQRIFQRT